MHPKTLLIVDDTRLSRTMIRRLIENQHPDWQFIEAHDGEQAIAQAHTHLPDFCTMDINMPGIPGTVAARQIQQQHPEIRIVIFSADIQQGQRQRAKEIGIEFVAKPVNETSIQLALQHLLAR